MNSSQFNAPFVGILEEEYLGDLGELEDHR